MGEIYEDRVEAYLRGVAYRRPVGLGDGAADAIEVMHADAQRFKFPIIGPDAGRVFFQMARMRRPRRILELGSGFGYSAIWWALGAGPQCTVHCTDSRLENIDRGRRNAEAAGVGAQLVWHQGDAIGLARELPGPWDIVFVDIDKDQYEAAYELMRPRLRNGDLLLFDNFLWHGRVATPPADRDAITASIVALTDRLLADAGLATSLLSLRDGVIVALCVEGEALA